MRFFAAKTRVFRRGGSDGGQNMWRRVPKNTFHEPGGDHLENQCPKGVGIQKVVTGDLFYLVQRWANLPSEIQRIITLMVQFTANPQP